MENESNQKVATIIINYNNSEVTINCINSIKDTESNKYTHIFIGDNSTNIEEYKRLNNYIKNNQEIKEFVNLIRIDHNEGFGSANNYVINNIDLTELSFRDQSEKIGFVQINNRSTHSDCLYSS